MKNEVKNRINELKSLLEKAFKDLSFKDSIHKYYVKGEELNTSTSGVIKNFYEPFDTEAQAIKKSEQSLGIMSKEDYLEEWSVLNTISTEGINGKGGGTNTHIFGELYPFDRSLIPSNKQEESCKKWWDEMPSHIHPLIMEQTMFHFKYMFGGTGDILLYNEKTDKLILGDYKTNKNIFNHFEKNMLGEWDFLKDEAFSHYIIQLNMYKIMLEQVVGIDIEGMVLIWLRRNGNYQMYKITEYKKESLKSLERVFNNVQ
jgi:hypothetical protein